MPLATAISDVEAAVTALSNGTTKQTSDQSNVDAIQAKLTAAQGVVSQDTFDNYNLGVALNAALDQLVQEAQSAKVSLPPTPPAAPASPNTP